MRCNRGQPRIRYFPAWIVEAIVRGHGKKPLAMGGLFEVIALKKMRIACPSTPGAKTPAANTD
jgi:hypothetical protein